LATRLGGLWGAGFESRLKVAAEPEADAIRWRTNNDWWRTGVHNVRCERDFGALDRLIHLAEVALLPLQDRIQAMLPGTKDRALELPSCPANVGLTGSGRLRKPTASFGWWSGS
jgi:hypothetical protein